MGNPYDSQFVPCQFNSFAINCALTSEQKKLQEAGKSPCDICGWCPSVERERKLANEIKYGNAGIYTTLEFIATEYRSGKMTREQAERRMKKLCYKLLDGK